MERTRRARHAPASEPKQEAKVRAQRWMQRPRPTMLRPMCGRRWRRYRTSAAARAVTLRPSGLCIQPASAADGRAPGPGCGQKDPPRPPPDVLCQAAGGPAHPGAYTSQHKSYSAKRRFASQRLPAAPRRRRSRDIAGGTVYVRPYSQHVAELVLDLAQLREAALAGLGEDEATVHRHLEAAGAAGHKGQALDPIAVLVK